MTEEDIIDYYINKSMNGKKPRKSVGESFRQKCINSGVDCNKAYAYRINHPDLDETEIIRRYKDNEVSNNNVAVKKYRLTVNNVEYSGLKDIASLLGISERELSKQVLKGKLTLAEIFCKYAKGAYINIIGNIIYDDLKEKTNEPK